MWNNSGVIFWTFDERIKTLYIGGHGDMPEFTLDDNDEDADIPWLDLKFERAILGYGITSVGTHSFLNCKYLKSVYLPDTVIEINDFAFEGCTSLECVRLPERLIYLGNSAFFNCASLRDIWLPDRMRNIFDYAFYGCSSLRTIEIPDYVEHIGYGAFRECGSLNIVIRSNSDIDIEDGAFDDDVKMINRDDGRTYIMPPE